MFQITKLAATATKLERKTIKDFSKLAIKIGEKPDAFVNEIKEMLPKDRSVLPYTKNIFKRAYYWIKTFITNYKEGKKALGEKIQDYKDHFGKVFTKKREKQVKKIITNGLKKEFKSAKEELQSILKKIKDEMAENISNGKVSGE